MKMTRSADRKAAECHVLNFFFDDEDSCALTVFHNRVRFHIIADAQRLKAKSPSDRAIEQEYKKLISAVQDEAEKEADPEKYQERKGMEAAGVHDSEDASHDSQDSGHETGDEAGDSQDIENDNDSAVDVSEEGKPLKETGVRDSGVVLGQQYASESEKAIQSWMLSPFSDIFKDLAPVSQASDQQTLQEWYHGQVYYYMLEIQDGQLCAEQEEASPELDQRIQELVPHMPVPKYIKDLDIPWIQAKDIAVVTEGAEPEPYHPTRVRVNGKVQFLKLVDMSQYQPTKREIKLLKEIENKGLHKQIRVPQVLGLVYEKSKTEIMGFLQTDIEDPTPLTKMLDSDVVEENREKWAHESERMIGILHKNKITWGDAKADNFMVDKHNDLWIIDFGGSYTDGWVDPELVETKEGDDMGVEKIVNALKDPEANTYLPGEENDQEDDDDDDQQDDQDDQDDEGDLSGRTTGDVDQPPKKRARDEDENEDEPETSSKRRR